jgi:predicted RND superfamily exporter protein
MIQNIVNYPWVLLFLLVILGLLSAGAARRVRRERQLKHRAILDRRTSERARNERRWELRK